MKKNDWERLNCGCCNGIKWGGFEPEECEQCGGSGIIWKHKKSNALAQYPSGKFLGKEKSND